MSDDGRAMTARERLKKRRELITLPFAIVGGVAALWQLPEGVSDGARVGIGIFCALWVVGVVGYEVFQSVDRLRLERNDLRTKLSELEQANVQGTSVRTRKGVLKAIPPNFSAEILGGLWVTAYQFKSERDAIKHHADISRVTAQSSRRLTARNYPPDPRTQTTTPVFRNDIEAHLVNRHLIGHWRNVGDMRYFGSVHLAVRTGEEVMDGYYTAFFSDIEVDARRWKWVRLDPVDMPSVELAHIKLKEPEMIYELVQRSDRALALSAVVEAA